MISIISPLLHRKIGGGGGNNSIFNFLNSYFSIELCQQGEDSLLSALVDARRV